MIFDMNLVVWLGIIVLAGLVKLDGAGAGKSNFNVFAGPALAMGPPPTQFDPIRLADSYALAAQERGGNVR